MISQSNYNMKNIFRIFLLFLLLSTALIKADNKNPLIYKINIKQNIGSNTWVYLQNGLHEALNNGSDCVLIHMNTYGGSVVEADSMRTAIINFPKPVYVFIDNNAASAGALISIACDSIFMKNSASIGAATVVSGEDGSKAPEKYQSYMRSIMRATAESHGKKTLVQGNDTVVEWRRNPLIAESMVDSSNTLTLTATEAVEMGYCDGIVDNINQIALEHLGYKEYDIVIYNPTFYDKIKALLTNGILQAFLIMLIIGGIYFELQSPGIGFPTAIAITAAILYFTPLYLTGYAQNWEVLIFVLGLILIIFEIFVIPGFGFVGISGISLVVISLIFSLIGNINFDFNSVSMKEMYRATMIVIAGIGGSVVLIIYASSWIGKPGIFRNIALISDQEGYVSVSLEPINLIGHSGVAATGLRPSGKVMIEDKYYDAISIKGYLEKDDNVTVVRYENFQLYVIKKDL